MNTKNYLSGKNIVALPATKIIGVLCRYNIENGPKNFQSWKASFGILPDREKKIKKQRIAPYPMQKDHY